MNGIESNLVIDAVAALLVVLICIVGDLVEEQREIKRKHQELDRLTRLIKWGKK